MAEKKPETAAEVLAANDQTTVYVECRLCDTCEHVGINDAHSVASACLSCEWNGPAPDEDKCPKCGRDGTMTAACPKCCGRYMFMADTEISVQAERALSAQGEAVGEVTIDPLVGVRWHENCGYGCDLPAGTKLYTHPAPAQVTEEAVERGWKAFVMSFGDLATPEEYLNHCTVNEMAELKKAIRAVLEADHGP